jgi:Tfp pilus assembly protein FimV
MIEESDKTPTLTPEQQKQLVDDAIERQERHAETELEMARLFIGRGKIDIGRRRLQEVVELYGKSDSAKEAKKLLQQLK